MVGNLELLLDEVEHDGRQPQSTSDNTGSFQSGIGHLLLRLLLFFWDFSTWTAVHFFFFLSFSYMGFERKDVSVTSVFRRCDPADSI